MNETIFATCFLHELKKLGPLSEQDSSVATPSATTNVHFKTINTLLTAFRQKAKDLNLCATFLDEEEEEGGSPNDLKYYWIRVANRYLQK